MGSASYRGRVFFAVLFTVLFTNSVPASGPSISPLTCMNYVGARFCLEDSSAKVVASQHDNFVRYDTVVEGHPLRLEEHGGYPTLDLVEGALWRMTYLPRETEFAVLLEQRLNGQTWWSFYLIGITPVLKITFKAQRHTEAWPFAQQAASKIYSCLPDSGQYSCETLPILQEMMSGHLLYSDEGLKVEPSIETSFNYIIEKCRKHFSKPCVKY